MTEMDDDYIMTEDESFDVLIIGGGISGLIAARELKKHEPELKVRDSFIHFFVFCVAFF